LTQQATLFCIFCRIFSACLPQLRRFGSIKGLWPPKKMKDELNG
jgi:hypothetical protein